MWADESVGADTTGITGASEELTVTVEGEEYGAELNADLNADGIDDTAIIERSDGSSQVFIDHDGDGAADEYIALDSQGEKVAQAAYDETTGDWVSIDPETTSPDDSDPRTSAGGIITADLPEGGLEIGHATLDTDNDGVNDSALIEDDAGNTVILTDLDGDGTADVAVTIDPRGNFTEYEYTGDGEWVEQTPHAAEPADDSLWGGGRDIVEGVAKIDSLTGQWISQN